MPDDKTQAATQNTTEAQGTQAAGSAPANNSAPVAGTDGAQGQNQSSEASRPPKGVETEFFKLRQDRRELRDNLTARETENAQLKARLEALEKEMKSRGSDKGGVDANALFDRPAEVLAETRKQAADDAYARIKHEQEQVALRSEAETAASWLRTRSHVKTDPMLKAEIAAMLAEGGKYYNAANVSPTAAANAAYLDVCRAKGITPDLSERPSIPASYGSTGVQPSAAGSSEGPIITPDNVKAFSKADVLKAVKEGRYRGKVITI